MIQAYRRGLLKPDYPFGKRSMLRERLMLDSLEAEIQAGLADRQSLLRAIVIAPAPLSKEGRQQEFKDQLQDSVYNNLIRMLDEDGATYFRYENSSLAATSLHEIMRAAGWVTGGKEPEAESDDGQ